MAAYKKGPRGINAVSVLMFLVFGALLYGGWKFGPKYYQALEVDAALDSVLPRAGRIPHLATDSRASSLLQTARQRIIESGVDSATLRVYYGPRYKSIHADYGVIVEHPFGPPTEWVFHREAEIKPLPR